MEKAPIECKKCNYKATTNQRLDEHYVNAHSKKIEESRVKDHNTRPHTATGNEQSQNRRSRQYCHYWNNYGSCNFQEQTGRECKYEHAKAPQCKYQADCDRKKGTFSHSNQNMNFVGQGSRKFQPPPPQFGF